MQLTENGGRRSVTLEGLGLHHGAPARVTLTASPGPTETTTLNGAPLHRWSAVRVERSTAITCDAMSARTVEHLFAALAALGLHRGVEIHLEGEEPPILDGAAAEWMDAAGSLALAPSPPELAVARGAVIDVGTSRYAFAPGDRINVSVRLEVADPRLTPRADWGGSRASFRTRIACARTFCFAHEVEELARAGLASHVKPEIVVVIGPSEILAAGRPFEADEPARHKLLDLVGDLFLYGGPPRGSVAVYRPGHWATHEAMRIARATGVLVPIPTAGGSG
jgi:UDP-3-O-[3-hydroxymyristoyl] N-acetylglucosamine deacetylase